MADNGNNGNNTIFRQKSLDRVSSVEDLDKYIKTTTPSLWLLLASIVIFLVGVIVWSAVGKINVESAAGCSVNNKIIACAISEDRYDSLKEDSYIEVDGEIFNITKVNGPLEASGDNLALLHNSNVEAGAWYYEVSGACSLSNGNYKGKVVFERISPITFVIN